jgi:hypothetical protein
MSQKYCVDLNTPIQTPLRDFKTDNFTSPDPQVWEEPAFKISKDFLKWLDELGLKTNAPIIFYTPPGTIQQPHIDGYDGYSDSVAMNWVIQSPGATMHWYRLKPGVNISKNITSTSTNYIPHNIRHTAYTNEQLIWEYSHVVQWPSLVQIGVPHNVTNFTTSPRWCISFNLGYKENFGNGLTWAQANQIFQSYIKKDNI